MQMEAALANANADARNAKNANGILKTGGQKRVSTLFFKQRGQGKGNQGN